MKTSAPVDVVCPGCDGIMFTTTAAKIPLREDIHQYAGTLPNETQYYWDGNKLCSGCRKETK